MHYLFLQAPVRSCFIIHFAAAYRALPKSRILDFTKDTGCNDLERALEVLDLISVKDNIVKGHESHFCLIQSCLENLVGVSPQSGYNMKPKNKAEKCILSGRNSSNWMKYDPFFHFHELHMRGRGVDITMVSGILSECGALGYLRSGLQFHALSVKSALDYSIPIGSALISLYSKFGFLEDACRVFNSINSKDTVLWTSIIAGFAQNWQVDKCLYLYVKMRQSTVRPNGHTLSSLLSACASAGCLQTGKIVHRQQIQLGFNAYLHVSNALISMYSKCGSIGDAFCIFKQIERRDIVSWNSMISACAHHGLAMEALDLLKQMETEEVLPDSITFLGVLSSCRHGGFVEQGRHCFDSMLAEGLVPEMDHYSCIVDLLGRAGLLTEALDFIKKMPIHPNAVIWGSLLSSCRLQGNIQIGIQAAESRLLLEPFCASTLVQLASMYSSIGDWEKTAKVRKCMKDSYVRTAPGYSSIEVANEIHRFKPEEGSNPHVKEIISLLGSLADHMMDPGYNSD